ncbi:MAG: YidC/Oxa1 family membrane protein insertase, partial [Oscillospiraceae bacterium]|nr:YidC/Oxa1 family membrane protein insertase [Oscillospiraceae bacterium]
MFEAISKPFGWLMMRLYEFTNNYGIAIILFAIIVRLIMLPFQMKSKRGMMRTQLLQPQMAELQKKYGNNKQKYAEEMQKL